MKKLSAIFLVAILASGAANAKDGFYVGADILHAKSSHTYIVKTSSFQATDLKSHAGSTGFSLNAGYKVSFDKVFIAPEIFYDHLKNSANDFYYDTAEANYQDRMNINNRYGAKMNLGYNIRPKFAVFVNAGLANVRYSINWPSVHNSIPKTRGAYKIGMVYGIGASYDIDNNWTLRLSHDRQRFNIQYVYEAIRSQVELDVTKLGVTYSF